MAANETTDKIEKSIQKSHFNAAASQRVAQSVTVLETKCLNVVELFGQIISKTATLDEVIDSITSASGEQNTGVDQIRNSIVQMDLITQSNAFSSNETADASHELAFQVSTIKDAVHQLEVFAGGHSTASLVDEEEEDADDRKPRRRIPYKQPRLHAKSQQPRTLKQSRERR